MSSSAKRNSPAGGHRSGSANTRLTEGEKKHNHILSEQKRRQAIRQGFMRLAAITPGMNGLGRSEASVLGAAVEELKKQLELKEWITKKLSERDDVDPEWLEAFYNHAIDPATNPVPIARATGQGNVAANNDATSPYQSTTNGSNPPTPIADQGADKPDGVKKRSQKAKKPKPVVKRED